MKYQRTIIIIICINFFLFFAVGVSAENLETIHTFPYSKEGAFTYVEKWVEDISHPGGPWGMLFFNESTMTIGYPGEEEYEIFDLVTMKKLQALSFPRRGAWLQNTTTIFQGTTDPGNSLMYTRNREVPFRFEAIKMPLKYNNRNRPSGWTYYSTGPMIFALGIVNGIVFSWEINPEGKVQYRDDIETEKWLELNGEKYGYRQTEGRITYFGENQLQSETFLTSIIRGLGYNNFWKLKETDPYPTEQALRNAGYQPIGRDRKGIEYRVLDHPNTYTSADPFVGSEERSYMILDPWSRRVIYRTVPAGQWQYLMAEDKETGDYYRLGGYGQGVHPSGDIYMFSANKKAGAFDLKRLKNDWWVELGADEKVIGRILGNHIPLRAEPSESAEVVAYNYENEYVWIQEETRRAVKYEGQATVWAKVQKLTGAVGWMPRAPIIMPD